MVTSVDVYQEIRQLQRNGITSQRAAAKMLGISRNTIKKYWEGSTVPWERKAYERDASVLTPEVVSFITACLDEDARESVRKQRHTARRIYNRLVDELGFTGSESSVRKVDSYGKVLVGCDSMCIGSKEEFYARQQQKIFTKIIKNI